MRNPHTRARESIKNLIAGSYDVGFLCLNMGIKVKTATFDMDLKRLHFETGCLRHEGKRKLVRQMRNAHTKGHKWIKTFIALSYDIGFLCSNMRIEAIGFSKSWREAWRKKKTAPANTHTHIYTRLWPAPLHRLPSILLHKDPKLPKKHTYTNIHERGRGSLHPRTVQGPPTCKQQPLTETYDPQ